MSVIKNNILYGPRSNYKPYTKGFGEFLFESIGQYNDEIFLINAETGDKETFKSIKTRSIRVAINMQKLGINSDHMVMSLLFVGNNNVLPFLGTLFIGAEASFASPTDTEYWDNSLKLTEPDCIFVDEQNVKTLEDCLERCNMQAILIVDGKSDKYTTLNDLLKECHEEESKFKPKEVTNIKEKRAVTVFTSGTTNVPKGLSFSHYTFPNLVKTFTGDNPASGKSIYFSFNNLNWVSGIASWAFNFYSGSETVVLPKFDPKSALETIQKYKVNCTQMLIHHFLEMIDLDNFYEYDTSSLKIIKITGEPMGETFLKTLSERFKHSFVLRAYGASECCHGGTVCDPSSPFYDRLKSMGTPQVDTEIKVVDRNTGEPLKPNQLGEIYIKSTLPALGYVKRPDLSPFDEEGFFRTADLGYYDEDGCLYVKCRIRDIININNREVYPPEFEEIFQRHPAVKRSIIFKLDDDEYPVGVYIFTRKNKTVTENELKEHFYQYVKDCKIKIKLPGGSPVISGNGKLKYLSF